MASLVAWAARQVQVAQMADSLAVVLVAALVRVVDIVEQAAMGQVLEWQFAHALGKARRPFCCHQSVVIACLTHFGTDSACPRHLPHSHLDVESAK